VPADVRQPFYTITDISTGIETRVYGVEICGAPLGEEGFRREWLRLKAIEISDNIEKISKNVAIFDPHCGNAITVFSLQSLSDFVLATNYPSDTALFVATVDQAIRSAFVRGLGTDLLDPEHCQPSISGLMDPYFISDRAKLRTSMGGASIRPLVDRQLFLNSICSVLPQLIDHTDATGNIIPGLFPSLSTTLGAGSFDNDNNASRWRSLLNSGTKLAADFSSEYNKGKEVISTLRGQVHLEVADRPSSIFDEPIEGFGFGIRKIHKTIQDERQMLQHQLITERAFNLPSDDPRRMAFLANGTDPFARHLLGTLPVASVPFTALEWTTAVALHMGVPIPALKNRVGETIRNNSNCSYSSVDHFGHNLTTVAGIEGGGTQRNHNTIAKTISSSLLSAGVKHLGGATDRTCKTVFRSAIPRDAVINEDTGKQVNSMIPDIVTFTKNYSADQCPLGGADHLIDVKTLGAGQVYHSNSRNFGNAVDKRQAQVNTDYHATALRLDSRLHGTLPGERGPFTRTLFEYGAEGRVLGPVVGAFGEASSDLRSLRDLCAHELAAKHVEHFRMTNDQARCLFRHQLNRKWGHTIARGWARLILDRLRDYVGTHGHDAHHRSSTHTNAQTNDAHEQFGFFNPAHSRQGLARE
jgi:hypothetical protein